MDVPAVSAPAAATADTLVVAETFGATFQGEGPSAGRRASFIRLGGCNLACTFCDTPYTWDATRHDLRRELTRRPVDEVVAEVTAPGVGLVVITGGEPLLHQHQPGWRRLLAGLTAAAVRIEIETNGTLVPAQASGLVDGFNVSPKLRNSQQPDEERIKEDALRWFAADTRAEFKFVCVGPGDLDEVDALVDTHRLPRQRVWIMPEGTRADAVLRRAHALAGPVLDRGYNLSLRQHVLLWGPERGR